MFFSHFLYHMIDTSVEMGRLAHATLGTHKAQMLGHCYIKRSWRGRERERMGCVYFWYVSNVCEC